MTTPDQRVPMYHPDLPDGPDITARPAQVPNREAAGWKVRETATPDSSDPGAGTDDPATTTDPVGEAAPATTKRASRGGATTPQES